MFKMFFFTCSQFEKFLPTQEPNLNSEAES